MNERRKVTKAHSTKVASPDPQLNSLPSTHATPVPHAPPGICCDAVSVVFPTHQSLIVPSLDTEAITVALVRSKEVIARTGP